MGVPLPQVLVSGSGAGRIDIRPYLIIRPHNRSFEFLCIGLDRLADGVARGLASPEGVAAIHVALEGDRERLSSALVRMVDDHSPSHVLLSRDAADLFSGMIAQRLPGLKIRYPEALCPAPGETPGADPFPGAALPVPMHRFKDGGALASWLMPLEEKGLPGGLAFPPWPVGPGENPAAPGPAPLWDLLDPWLDQKSPSQAFSLSIPPKTDVSPLGARLTGLAEQGLAMIRWQVRGPEADLPRKLLWQASKQGIWNHVSGPDLFAPGPGGLTCDKTLGGWIANNPNIVHSFENLGPGAQSPESVSGSVHAPASLMAYGRLPALPGLALWQMVRDPGLLLGIVGRIGKKELLRLRMDPPSGRLSRLGQSLTYHFKKPRQISPERMEEIIAMVDAGGSVDITHVRKNLEKAYLIGYALEKGVIAGNSSLKHPRQQFIDRLRGITGLDFTRCLERGYTSVRPEYRAMGIGARLLEGLTARAGDLKIFSIIGEDNLATQTIALRNRTRKIAVYFSEKTGKKMGVWMPEHMIEDGIVPVTGEGEKGL